MPQFTIREVTVDTVTKGRNSYQQANVLYVTNKGENKEKKVMSFSNPKVFAVASKAQPNETYEVTYVEGDQYYNWATMERVSANASNSQAAPAAKGGTYVDTRETPDERAQRQLMIVRQSSLGHAIEVAKHNSPGMTIDEEVVLDLAQKFVDFVYGTEETLESMDSDIPY